MWLWYWFFFFSSRRRHTRFDCDWSSDVCSSDLPPHIDQRRLRSVRPTKKIDPVITEPRAHVVEIIHRNGRCVFRQVRALLERVTHLDRKSTRLNSSHSQISYAVFCLKKKNNDSH